MSAVPKHKWTYLRLFLIGLACAAAVSLYPFKSVACPPWTIQVVDEAGHPLRRVFVRQVWGYYYSFGRQSHEQDTDTDENGYISFPERTVRVNLLYRTLGAIFHILPHTSYGPTAYVLAYGDVVEGKRLEGSAYYQEGKPVPVQLVTHVYNLDSR